MNSNGFQQSAYSKYSISASGQSDVDVGNDIVKTGNIFMSDPKKHEDLKALLESNKDSAKLDAMKRIISMVAKGKDCADLFPAVVKNVVSKNAEVKKLVYAYLTRYAEEQQDLALLSISTFQRALKDPNQLIRGSALRVLSSIRVPMIVPIMMLAIRDCVMDMSPYVRKIAAHAIPKMYSLDASTKEQLIEVIERLLADKTTLVAGSAIQAFEEVCPERLDLIHKHYRKLCSLLIDVEEWGQVVIINMLTRYVRTQFVDPNVLDSTDETNKNFYSDDDNDVNSSNSSSEERKKKDNNKTKSYTVKSKTMDADHRLLLNSVRPLLHSRNSAVVMSVVQLYYHSAPKSEMNVVIKSLIRLIKSNREVQYVVLNNIATMTTRRPELFLSHLKTFYVYNSDPVPVKLLKLEILTNLANESNISVILRELQSYVGNTDQEFVKATIQAIGRCASNVAEVSDSCLSGLVHLISRKDENIVAEAVVVIRKLLQMQSLDHRDIIVSMAVLLDSINVPMAKASIIWLIGEYCDRVPKLGPDILRKAAKTFVDEKDIVKLQILNLATKLYITNPRQTRLLVQYVLNLAKYDLNYDIRDRARFIRGLIFPVNQEKDESQNGSTATSFLSRRVKKIFLATKPAPLLQSNFRDRYSYQLGTMSHILNQRVVGYKELPNWPDVAPDPSVRNVKEVDEYTTGGLLANEPIKRKKVKEEFYSSEDESKESSSEDSSSSSGDSSDEAEEKGVSGSESQEESESEESSSSDDERQHATKPETLMSKAAKASERITKQEAAPKPTNENQTDETSGSETTEDSSDFDSNDSDTASSSNKPVKPTNKEPKNKSKSNDTSAKVNSSKAPEVDLLLDFDEPVSALSQPAIVPQAFQQVLVAKPNAPKPDIPEIYIPVDIPLRTVEVLPQYSNAYLKIDCQFTRSLSVSMVNPKLISVNLNITNVSSETIYSLRLMKSLSAATVESFSQIDTLLPQKTVGLLLGIDFKDSTQPVVVIIGYNVLLKCETSIGTGVSDEVKQQKEQERQVELRVSAPIGEIIQPINMTENVFCQHQKRLRGMNESIDTIQMRTPVRLLPSDFVRQVSQTVYAMANVTTVSNTKEDVKVVLRYAGNTSSGQLPCIVEIIIDLNEAICKVRVNSEQITVISQLCKELVTVLRGSLGA